MENIMKILFYNGSLRMGGAEKILTEILRGLEGNYREIDLIIADGIEKDNFFADKIPKSIKINYLKPESLIEKTEYHRERKSNIFHKIAYNFYMKYEHYIKRKNLKRFLKDKKYDVVIDFDMGLSKYIDLVKGDRKIAWIHSPIDSWYRKKDKIARLGERLKKYDRLVTICEDMKEKTENLYPFLKSKIVRIYNPFDVELIRRKSEDLKGMSKEKLELLKEKYIIAVARLDNYSKDFYTLFKGYKIVKDMGIEEKLYILGEGDQRDLIESWIEELDLKDRVILIGREENPYVWMKNSELFVHSSRFEGLPTVLIEAMICGKIVISSDCPTGPREILNGEEYGALYNVGDYNKLGEEIYFYLKNKDEKEILEKRLEERIKDFSKEKSLKKIREIIDGKN